MASIFLAVGHGVSTDGSWDCGCTNGNYTEAALMLAIGKKTAALLRQSGIKVVTDADTNNDRNMTYTVRDANAAGVDCYVSLHCDYNQAPSGTLPIIYPGSTAGSKLASTIDNYYRQETKIGTRGILQRDDYEVSYTEMPACIFETGSISKDLNTLKNSDLCAVGISKGICSYFGVKYKNSKDPSPVPTPTPTPTPTYNWDTKDVQYYLYICNYGAPDIDGIWGSETERCLKQAQKTNGLVPDGLWGPKTEAKAIAQIKGYQTLLNRKGYKCTVDGIPGPETLAAVKKFQKNNKLTADGIIGAATIKKLVK